MKIFRAALPLIAAALALAPAAALAKPRTILFVGNSFTQGAHSAAQRYRADAVTDLVGSGYGGVPALFKTFTEEAGLDYAVSLETQGGKSLAFHYQERKALLDKPWDVVVLQEYSTLDRLKPGDPTSYRENAGLLAAMFARRNPAVNVQLMATWTRADQTYKPGGHWYGKPVTAMADDLRAAGDAVCASTRDIRGVLPVGQAFSRAIADGVADADPYDGTSFGQVDLWTYDHYHASTYGYYLEALVVFGRVTGLDPQTLGAKERAADDLGISPEQAVALQRIAHDTLAAAPAACAHR